MPQHLLLIIVPGDAISISYEQEMKKRAEWATEAFAANQPISPFPIQILLHHPVPLLIRPSVTSHLIQAIHVE